LFKAWSGQARRPRIFFERRFAACLGGAPSQVIVQVSVVMTVTLRIPFGTDYAYRETCE
jgi:hypothetical protein